MTSFLWRVGRGGSVRQKWDVIGGRVGGGGLASVLGNNQSLFFIYLLFFCFFGFFCMTENWICTINRYHVEANINIMSVHRNLPFDSKVRQWSHPLIILVQCLLPKSNNRTCGQFECERTCFCFCFNFVRSYARYYLESRGLFETGSPRSRSWRNFRCRWIGAVGSWKLDNFHGHHIYYP